jgi:hypothetical protein
MAVASTAPEWRRSWKSRSVLVASRDGASINAVAQSIGDNFRNAQRIVKAAADHRQRHLVAVG